MSLQIPNFPKMPRDLPKEVQRAFDAITGFFKQAEAAGGLATANDVATEVLSALLDTSTPPQMTGLVVTGLFDKIMLQWDAYSAEAQIEIHRSETDDLGAAAQVGQCPSTQSIFSDLPPDSSLSVTYYYWIRANRNGTPGPWNQTAGTSGNTADDPEYLLEVAAEKWKPSYNYALAALTLPLRPNGYCYEVTVDAGSSGSSEPDWPTVINDTVTDGDLTWKCKAAFSFEEFFKVALVAGVPRLTLKELFLADAIIKRAMIADLAVDTAKIDNLAVTDAQIAALAVTTAKIADLAVTNAQIGLLAVDTANIADAAIESAKIGTAAIETLHVDGEQITAARFASGEYSCSIPYTLTETTNVVLTATFTQGAGRDGFQVDLNVDGSPIQSETPIAGTLGAMSRNVSLAAGAHTFSISTMNESGDMSCGLTVIVAKR